MNYEIDNFSNEVVNYNLFGGDNQMDFYNILNPQAKGANSVAAIFRGGEPLDAHDIRKRIQPHPSKPYSSRLTNVRFSDIRTLCPSVRFRDQPIGAGGTAFLICSNVVVTAQHNIRAILSDRRDNIADIKFVFGFQINSQNESFEDIVSVSNSNIYSAKRIMAESQSDDWAIIELDRNVSRQRLPLKMRTETNVVKGEELYIIGFPHGLPLKLADNAKVMDDSENRIFKANLETFPGNSGSPIFSLSDHQVVGILSASESAHFAIGRDKSNNKPCEEEIRNPPRQYKVCVRITLLRSSLPTCVE